MKSLRLKRHKHSKSCNHKSRKLNKSRKLRRGGNGTSSSASSSSTSSYQVPTNLDRRTIANINSYLVDPPVLNGPPVINGPPVLNGQIRHDAMMARVNTRRGGNGKFSSSSSSSSSEVNLKGLIFLLNQYIDCKNLIEDEITNNEDINDINELEKAIKEIKEELIHIFKYNKFDLSSLNYRSDIKGLLKKVVSTDAEITEAYADAYLNIDEGNLMITEIIQELKNEYQSEIDEIREEIMDEAGEMEEEDENNIRYFESKISNLNIVLGILLPHDALMVDRIRAVRSGEEPGPVSKNSDHIGLPGPLLENVMSYLEGPNYRHVSSHPHPHPILGADWNANSSSSSSSNTLGGRRTRRRIRTRKLRKSIRRK